MVLEHQAHFSNLVTRAAWESKLGETLRIAEAADALADYMLFVDEAKIPGPGIEGSSGFAEKFNARGKLYELDLRPGCRISNQTGLLAAFKALRSAEELLMGKIMCAAGKSPSEICALTPARALRFGNLKSN